MRILRVCFVSVVVLGIMADAHIVRGQVMPPTDGMGNFLTCTEASPYDRFYQLGDDPGENGTVGSQVGIDIGGDRLTFDSIGTSMAGDFNDLAANGQPVYADTSGRPFARTNERGVRFDGANDYLVGTNLNWPQQSRSSILYVDEDNNPAPGPCNYVGIELRTLQFWVRPDAAGLGNGVSQSLVVDSNEHGVLISANDTWVLRYDDVDVDSGVAVDTDWHHVMVSNPFGPSGSSGGGRLWIDGLAVAAEAGDYNASRVELVVGANTARDENNNFTGGMSQFFAGDIDRLLMSVIGDSSGDDGPPPGQDYGDFNFAQDNDFATGFLSGVEGDLNNDGMFDDADRTAFISGWFSENLVNGLRAGDLNSFGGGDLDFNGITDINDLAAFQQLLVVNGMSPIAPGELVPEPSAVILLTLGMLWIFGNAGRIPRVISCRASR